MVCFAGSSLLRRVDLNCSEILALRKGMWEKVASRKHKAIKIFPFGPDSNECMLYGTVQYGLKVGGESGVDWAARAHLVKDGGKVKMDFYQVYLVSVHCLLRTSLTGTRTLPPKTNRLLAVVGRIRMNQSLLM
jgi:hypothetical protein